MFLSVTVKGPIFVDKAPSLLHYALIKSLHKVSSNKLKNILRSFERIALLMNEKGLDESLFLQEDLC